MIVLWRTPWLIHKVLFPKRQSAGDTRVLRLKIVCCQKHVISYDQKSWPDLAKGTPTQTSQSHGRTSQVQVSHAFSSSDTMWPGRLNLKTVLVIPIKFANSIPFCLFAETWHTGIRFTLRIGLSAGFKGCTRHLLRALAQWHLRHSLAAQYSGRSALGYSEARRQGCSALQMLISIAECACRLPTMV